MLLLICYIILKWQTKGGYMHIPGGFLDTKTRTIYFMKLLDKKNMAMFIVFGLSFIIGLVFLVVPFTSDMPDGLEKVSENTVGFLKRNDVKSQPHEPMPDYRAPGLKNKFDIERYAAVIGVCIVFGITIFAGYLLKKRRKNV